MPIYLSDTIEDMISSLGDLTPVQLRFVMITAALFGVMLLYIILGFRPKSLKRVVRKSGLQIK